MKKTLKQKRTLSNYDHNVLLPILMKGLELKKGRENAVTSNQIVSALRGQGLKIVRCDLIMLINHIRTNDLLVGLMASKAGYYISTTEQELIGYEGGLLSREREIRKVRMSIQRQRQRLFAPKQLEIF